MKTFLWDHETPFSFGSTVSIKDIDKPGIIGWRTPDSILQDSGF